MHCDPITLRLAVADDAAAISDLAFRSKASNGYDAAFMEASREELTCTPEMLARGETWIAEQDGRILGFAGICPDGGMAELWAMFVEPAAKGNGVGLLLWRQIEARAKVLGFTSIGADADPFAEGFYLKMGMVRTGQSPSGSIAGRMLPRMQKILG